MLLERRIRGVSSDTLLKWPEGLFSATDRDKVERKDIAKCMGIGGKLRGRRGQAETQGSQ